MVCSAFGLYLLIPMRDAARTPAPPDFVVCDLLRLRFGNDPQQLNSGAVVSV